MAINVYIFSETERHYTHSTSMIITAQQHPTLFYTMWLHIRSSAHK